MVDALRASLSDSLRENKGVKASLRRLRRQLNAFARILKINDVRLGAADRPDIVPSGTTFEVRFQYLPKPRLDGLVALSICNHPQRLLLGREHPEAHKFSSTTLAGAASAVGQCDSSSRALTRGPIVLLVGQE